MKRSILVILTLLMVLGLYGCGLSQESSVSQESSTSTEIKQVLPTENGIVAVLFSNGTVRVVGNDRFSKAVADWSSVDQLYYQRNYVWENEEFRDDSYIVGLTEDGAVLSTADDFPIWTNVKEIHSTYCGIIGITEDGRVLLDHTWSNEGFKSALSCMSGVETLVCSDIQGSIACLKQDGSVQVIFDDGYIDPHRHWENVKEVKDSGHAFYVVKKDGTVDGGLEESYPGLKDAVKIVDYYDWIFGVSADGRLLTYNGGNIFTNGGDWRVDVPGSPENWYTGEVDVSKYNQVEDIVVFGGLILLNQDGTVDSIGEYPSWDLSDWKDIQKVYCTADSNWNSTMLYGIHQDGTVIFTRNNGEKMVQTVIDAYRGWNLQEIYPGVGGVVGLTTDGNLVGDGSYENVDFSFFKAQLVS